MGLKFLLFEESASRTRIELGDKSIVVEQSLERLSQLWYYWQIRGDAIQVAFSELTSGEREFLMTGITPAEWAEMFSEEEW
jgi:hypothetical protein